VVDSDDWLRARLQLLIGAAGLTARLFKSAEEYLNRNIAKPFKDEELLGAVRCGVERDSAARLQRRTLDVLRARLTNWQDHLNYNNSGTADSDDFAHTGSAPRNGRTACRWQIWSAWSAALEQTECNHPLCGTQSCTHFERRSSPFSPSYPQP